MSSAHLGPGLLGPPADAFEPAAFEGCHATRERAGALLPVAVLVLALVAHSLVDLVRTPRAPYLPK